VGGWTGREYSNAMYLIEPNSWLTYSSHYFHDDIRPPACKEAQVVFEPEREEVLLFGGYNPKLTGSNLQGQEPFNQLYILDSSWKWRNEVFFITSPNEVPCARRGHSLCISYLFEGCKMWLYGGIKGCALFLNDLFYYNLKDSHWH